VNCSIIRSSGIKGTIKAAAFLLSLKLTNIWPILKRKKRRYASLGASVLFPGYYKRNSISMLGRGQIYKHAPINGIQFARGNAFN